MKELIKSISNIQANLGNASKTGKNTFGKGFDYSKESEILEYLKPFLEKEGVSYSFDIDKNLSSITKDNENKYTAELFGDLYIYKGEAQIKSGFIVGASNTDKAKAVGSAMTYMVRYVLAKAFGISTDKLDPDTTDNTTAVRDTKPKATRPQVNYNETSIGASREATLKAIKNLSMNNTKFADYLKELGINKGADFEKYKDNELLNILKGKL